MLRQHNSLKGDTENLLAQKLPLLSSRLIERLKYCVKGVLALSGKRPKRQLKPQAIDYFKKVYINT
jgi:hypothetical protein